jgi:uncharacterized protein YjiS (DUF1127 family)
MDEILLGGSEPLLRDRPRDGGAATRGIAIASDIPPAADRLPALVGTVSARGLALVVPQGTPTAGWSGEPVRQLASTDVETTKIAPVGVIRSIAAAIRQRRRCARPRRHLHELSDQVLKDIGVCRQELLPGLPRTLWYFD